MRAASVAQVNDNVATIGIVVHREVLDAIGKGWQIGRFNNL